MVNIIHAYLEREKPSGVQNKGLPVSVCLLCYPKNEKKKSYEKERVRSKVENGLVGERGRERGSRGK